MIDMGVADTYADDLAEVQDLGACIRFVYCSFTTSDQVVVAKIVRPKNYYQVGKSGLLLASGPRLAVPPRLLMSAH